MHSKFERDLLQKLPGQIAGRLLAEGIAKAVELAFGFLALQDKKAFFDENFVMRDPEAPNDIRYYQGKFLIRTKQPDDDMNVYIRFCPNPDNIYLEMPLGNLLNPLAVIKAEAVDEKAADGIETDPERVDLVIRFRDIPSILGLVQRPNADPVQLLLENLVQITGNFGHLFKFGAIGKNAQSAVTGHA
jgi:hypothetical protein